MHYKKKPWKCCVSYRQFYALIEGSTGHLKITHLCLNLKAWIEILLFDSCQNFMRKKFNVYNNKEDLWSTFCFKINKKFFPSYTLRRMKFFFRNSFSFRILTWFNVHHFDANEQSSSHFTTWVARKHQRTVAVGIGKL